MFEILIFPKTVSHTATLNGDSNQREKDPLSHFVSENGNRFDLKLVELIN